MRKVVVLGIVFLFGCFMVQAQNTKTTDEGVVIGGVKWATRNVDEFGTFAEKPENFGMFYQWNRKLVWSAIDPIEGVAIPNWNASYTQGSKWEQENDPCPVGWRVPTKEEQQTLLLNTEKELTTQNGIMGLKLTDKVTGNSLFFPARGFRSDNTGTLSFPSAVCYWSSTPHESDETIAYLMIADRGKAGVYHFNNRDGLLVRCVAE